MKATELRPNNLIIGIYENEEDDGLHEIICTFKFYDCYSNYFYVESKNNITDFSGFKPIPLTEEILKDIKEWETEDNFHNMRIIRKKLN